MEPVGRTRDHGRPPRPRGAGTIKGAANCAVDVIVAIETVVADHEVPEILTIYSITTRTDADGRFTDRYDFPTRSATTFTVG